MFSVKNMKDNGNCIAQYKYNDKSIDEFELLMEVLV